MIERLQHTVMFNTQGQVRWMGVVAVVAVATTPTAACCQHGGCAGITVTRVARVSTRTQRMTDTQSEVSESAVVMHA